MSALDQVQAAQCVEEDFVDFVDFVEASQAVGQLRLEPHVSSPRGVWKRSKKFTAPF